MNDEPKVPATNISRVAFEKWMRMVNDGIGLARSRTWPARYTRLSVQMCWEAWQAAHTAALAEKKNV